MIKLALKVWRLVGRRWRWRLLWLTQAKFMAGVSGIVQDSDGRILLLKHRFWPPARPWGLPSGYAKGRETLEETLAREVLEETKLRVDVTELITVNSGLPYRIEAVYKAKLLGGELKIDSKEILDAQWFEVDSLPDGLLSNHRKLIAGLR